LTYQLADKTKAVGSERLIVGHTDLRGASLNEAHLEGALLFGAQLQGASLDKVRLWRANASHANTTGTRIVAIRKDSWSTEAFDQLKVTVERAVPEGILRTEALERIMLRLNPKPLLEDEEQISEYWERLTTRLSRLTIIVRSSLSNGGKRAARVALRTCSTG
jgi:hypothetical protein